MVKHIVRLLGLVVFSAALTGCATSGIFGSKNLTDVELSQSNFVVVESNVYGEASADYLLGLSLARGGEMQTMALVPLKHDRMLYKRALENLWRNFEQTNGNIKGRSLALVNVRFDSEALNLFLYTKATISVRADVVEFVE